MVHFEFIEVSHTNLAYLTLGGFVVFFSMVSLLVKEKLYLGECVLATAFGIAIGPAGGKLFNPRSWGSINLVTLEVMRVVLAAGVFAIGVELPKSYMARHWKSLIFLVVPTMAIGWFISAGLLIAFFPRLSFISSLVISACLTPTDPILANAIVMGKFAVKNVPRHIRLLLSAESAANDGLAYPFLSISLYLSLEASKRVAIEKWFIVGWIYQVLLGVVLGVLIGTGFNYVLKFAQSRRFIDRESFVAQYLALAIFSVGLSNLLGSDDLLTAFAAGTAISWDGDFNVQTEDDAFSAILDLILNCAAFIYIGAWIPFEDFHIPELGIVPWRLVVFGICILIVRRIPAILLLQKAVPDIHDWREALFCGHFGPMGVGAVYISTLALIRLPEARTPAQDQLDVLGRTIQPVVAFMVLVSLCIHGLSIPFFRLGKRVHTRTLTITNTWTLSRPQSPIAPEWLQLTRRVQRTNGAKNLGDPESGRQEIDLSSETGGPSASSRGNVDRMQGSNASDSVDLGEDNDFSSLQRISTEKAGHSISTAKLPKAAGDVNTADQTAPKVQFAE